MFRNISEVGFVSMQISHRILDDDGDGDGDDDDGGGGRDDRRAS